jgi:hypothetical protein
MYIMIPESKYVLDGVQLEGLTWTSMTHAVEKIKVKTMGTA